MLNLSRPDLSYGITWVITGILALLVPVAYSQETHPHIAILVISHILSFFCIYYIFWFKFERAYKFQGIDGLPVEGLTRYGRTYLPLFTFIYCALFLVTILYSGGIGVYWYLTGSEKNYLNFGLPTLSGLLNMIRSLLLNFSFLIYLKTRKTRDLIIPCIFIFACLLELTRGSVTVIILNIGGLIFFYYRASLLNLLKAFLFGVFAIIMFGVMADMRGQHTSLDSLVGEQDFFLDIPTGFFWVYTYMVSPINNINYAYTAGITPTYAPNFTLQPLLPTIIRDHLFGKEAPPVELLIEAFNATSYYSPLIADFGIFGAFFFVLIIQSISCYVYFLARRGNLVSVLFYPVIFMSNILSVFYLYHLSLVVVLYPIFAYLISRHFYKYLNRTHKTD